MQGLQGQGFVRRCVAVALFVRDSVDAYVIDVKHRGAAPSRRSTRAGGALAWRRLGRHVIAMPMHAVMGEPAFGGLGALMKARYSCLSKWKLTQPAVEWWQAKPKFPREGALFRELPRPLSLRPDLFIFREFTIRNLGGDPVCNNSLFRFPYYSAQGTAIVPVVLGLAQAGLDRYRQIAESRIPV